MATTCVDEIRFRNLLNKCKQRAVDKQPDDFWRLEQYVTYLCDLLSKLEKDHSKIIGDDVMKQYREDVKFLRNVIATEKEPDLNRKLIASQNLVVPNHESSSPSQPNRFSPVSLKSVKIQTTARVTKDLRRQLLGLDDVENDQNPGLRLRKTGDVLETKNSDIDAVLKHHYHLQEQLADQFLNLTLNLKHNVVAAGQVVRDDTKTLDRIQTSADKNYKDLGVESSRLAKYAYASCDFWIWLMLLAVCMTFIGMVLFMRLFPKRWL